MNLDRPLRALLKNNAAIRSSISVTTTWRSQKYSQQQQVFKSEHHRNKNKDKNLTPTATTTATTTTGGHDLIKPNLRFSNKRINVPSTSGSSSSDGESMDSDEFGKYLLLIIPVVSFGLGVWQVIRWRWKLQLIDEMEQRVSALPIQFPINNLEELDDLEFKKVIISGRFDPTEEILIGPRSRINPGREEQSQGLISQGSISHTGGYLIITPFKVSNSNMRILVNRGWIPNKHYLKYKPNDDEIEITGVVRKTEKRTPFMIKNKPGSRFWIFRDIPNIAAILGTDEIFLDLASYSKDINDNSLVAKDSLLPVPGQTRVSLRNEHVQYFFTWFSLSAITFYMWRRLCILRLPLL